MAVEDIFKEIGNTLADVGKQALRQGVATIRTTLAERFAATPAGQQTIQEFKFREIGRMLPVIVAVVVGVFLLGRLARG